MTKFQRKITWEQETWGLSFRTSSYIICEFAEVTISRARIHTNTMPWFNCLRVQIHSMFDSWRLRLFIIENLFGKLKIQNKKTKYFSKNKFFSSFNAQFIFKMTSFDDIISMRTPASSCNIVQVHASSHKNS